MSITTEQRIRAFLDGRGVSSAFRQVAVSAGSGGSGLGGLSITTETAEKARSNRRRDVAGSMARDDVCVRDRGTNA